MSSGNYIPLITRDDFIVSNQTSEVFNDDPLMSILRFICELGLSLPLSILGVVGNLLSLYILSLYSKKKLQIILILLRMLSVVDTLVLLFNLHLRSLRYIFTRGYFVVVHAYTYPVIHPIIYILRMVNTWLTVLLTMDRYLAVCKPLHAYALSSVRKTYMCVGGVLSFSILFCLPRFFESYTKEQKDGRYGFKTTNFLDDHTYTVVYRIFLFICFQYLLPGTILTCINTKVIILLRASDTFRKNQLTSNDSRLIPQVGPTKYLRKCRTEWDIRISVNTRAPAHVTRSAFQSTRNITIVVTIVVMISIICLTVNMTAHILHCLEAGFKKHPILSSLTFSKCRRIVAQFSNVLVTFNSASNFLVYCFCSKNFRTLLGSCLCKKLFCTKFRGRTINTEIEWEQHWRMRFVRRTN